MGDDPPALSADEASPSLRPVDPDGSKTGTHHALRHAQHIAVSLQIHITNNSHK